MPETMSGFEMFEGEGFVVYVHRDTMQEAEKLGVVRFNFGSLGWCELSIGEPPVE